MFILYNTFFFQKFPSAFVLLAFLSASNGYKILFLAPFSGPSHWNFLKNFAIELLNRGHEVTCVTNEPLTEHNSTKYTEILIDPPLDLSVEFCKQSQQNKAASKLKNNKFVFEYFLLFLVPQNAIYESKYTSDLTNIQMLHACGSVGGEYALKDSNVRKLALSNGLHFDLVINEQFFQEAWLMFAHKFNAPIVTISTYGASDFFDRAMGMLTPWSHVPHVLLSYTDEMAFTDRAYNAYLSICEWIYRNWYALPEQNRQAQQFFGHLVAERNGQPLPTVQQLERDIALILINTHRSISTPRPMMPGLINVGGAHIKEPKPLPADIQRFLDKSTNGVIYFSLGLYMQASRMPKEKLNIFLNTFTKLKQTVLWKFEDETLENVPSNVMIRKRFPQSDVLAHKNVVLFISHGGMFGTFEGIARGKPMLFTPLYGDQHRNALRAENHGYGRKLNFKDIAEETLYAKIIEMTANDTYRKKSAQIAAIYRDNLVHPMEESIFWIEYVCRHKGAKHLKSHAINMSWFSYLMLDVLVCVLFAVYLVLLFAKLLIRKTLGGRKTQSKTKRH